MAWPDRAVLARHRARALAGLAELDRHVPLFFKDEDPDSLMQHPPPYGYRFQRITQSSVRARQANATVPTKRHFGSCAVVGNSGTLKLKELGAEIDSHDAVFRVNHAPGPQTAEGQKYVRWSGSRTTWRIVTSRWFDEAKRDPTQRILAVCDRPFICTGQRRLNLATPQNLSSPAGHIALTRPL